MKINKLFLFVITLASTVSFGDVFAAQPVSQTTVNMLRTLEKIKQITAKQHTLDETTIEIQAAPKARALRKKLALVKHLLCASVALAIGLGLYHYDPGIWTQKHFVKNRFGVWTRGTFVRSEFDFCNLGTSMESCGRFISNNKLSYCLIDHEHAPEKIFCKAFSWEFPTTADQRYSRYLVTEESSQLIADQVMPFVDQDLSMNSSMPSSAYPDSIKVFYPVMEQMCKKLNRTVPAWFRIMNVNFVNAYASAFNDTISFTLEALKLHTFAELFGILAHELGHFKFPEADLLQDYNIYNITEAVYPYHYHNKEIRADLVAAALGHAEGVKSFLSHDSFFPASCHIDTLENHPPEVCRIAFIDIFQQALINAYIQLASHHGAGFFVLEKFNLFLKAIFQDCLGMAQENGIKIVTGLFISYLFWRVITWLAWQKQSTHKTIAVGPVVISRPAPSRARKVLSAVANMFRKLCPRKTA